MVDEEKGRDLVSEQIYRISLILDPQLANMLRVVLTDAAFYLEREKPAGA